MKAISLTIGFLSYQRELLFQRTLESFFRNVSVADSIHTNKVCFDNGSSYEALQRIKKLCVQYNVNLFHRSENLAPTQDFKIREERIMDGLAALASRMYETKADYYMLIEDDWECAEALQINSVIAFLTENPQVGQVRLRECPYDGSLTGYSKVNFVTGREIIWENTVAFQGLNFALANLHWTNNPSILLPAGLNLIRERHSSEISMMKAFQEMFPANAQLFPGIFKHIGPWRERKDLAAEGIKWSHEK